MGGGGGGWTGLVVSWKTIVFYCVCSQPRALLTYFNPVRKNIKFVLDLTRHSSESSPLPPRNRQQTPCCCLAGTTFSFTTLTSAAGIKLFLTAEKSHISLITLNFPNTEWNHCILFCVIKWKILTCHARVKSTSSLEFSVFPLCLVGFDLRRISFILYLVTHALQSWSPLCAISVSSDQSRLPLAEDVEEWRREGLPQPPQSVSSGRVLSVMQTEHKLYCSSLSISQSRNHGRKRNFLS